MPFMHGGSVIQSFDGDSRVAPEKKVEQWRRLKAQVLDHPPRGCGPPNVQWGRGRRGISEGARNFIERALERDPERRWTAQQLVGHPWLRGRIAEFERVFGPAYLGAGGAGTCIAAAAAAAAAAAVTAAAPAAAAAAVAAAAAAGGGGVMEDGGGNV